MVGDVVIVHTENQLRSHWKLGITKRVKTGANGEVRASSVQVTTNGKSNNTLCRPIQHLYPLEVRRSKEEDAIQECAVVLKNENDKEQETQSDTERPRRATAARARDQILAQAIL